MNLSPGSLVASRYWVWSAEIWVDTRPEDPVVPLEILPRFVVPYLRLSTLPQYMARPFTVISPEYDNISDPVLLLDAAPIGSRLTDSGEVEPFLLPPLQGAWAEGSALQQLNWLRQIAELWPPLAHQGVASTLLSIDTIRVDHALIRLSRLTLDAQSDQAPTLMALGEQWQPLIAQAKPEIQPYLSWLIMALAKQEMASAEGLAAELDQAVRTLAKGLSLEVDWVADTDQGPERPRNEDACYPEGQLHQVQLVGHGGQELPMLLVCDGIGGHEQGNIASQTAIKVLLEELQPLADQPDPGPQMVGERLHRALARANDAISDRNNDEKRSARARMGTTVVLGLVHFPYVSIAHIGDSRAYRITDSTCYQVTLDDDIASRETRLGYTLYPEALQIPNSGALIQALGISDSAQLYPTVHHVLIDDPAILLLCSDGLSDYDRVEMLWRHDLSPLVQHRQDLPSAGQGLIQQANRLNGHDNVTVGLLRFTPKPSAYSTLPAEALHRSTADSLAATAAPKKTQLVASADQSPQPETVLPSSAKFRFPWPLLLGSAALVALAAGVASWRYSLRQPQTRAITPLAALLAAVKTQGDSLDMMSWAVAEAVNVGSLWQAGTPTPVRRSQLLELSPSPTAGSQSASREESAVASTTPAPVLVPTGSILKVVSRQTAADETIWIRLQVCSIPSGASLDQPPRETDGTVPSVENEPDLSRRLSSPGQSGWVLERELYRSATLLPRPTEIQRGNCTP